MSGKTLVMIFLIFHQICFAISTNSSDILYDIPPFVRVYKNGTVQRLVGTDVVSASLDPTTGVRSKDVEIAPDLNVSARLYLPKNASPARKLPVLVYFHGGAFFTGCACSSSYQKHLNSIVAKANVVAVSVNYRLAPEYPLPIGYEDSWLALKWVFSHCKANGSEVWLKKYADFELVYLGGDSAGGNIAHNVAIRAGLESILLQGMFLTCPHFWGKKPIGNEAASFNIQGKNLMESIWVHAYPKSLGFDDPASNPAMDPNLSRLGCKRVLVYVAEKDILRDRGLYYKKALIKSKWNGTVKVVEAKGEEHVFSIRFPNKPKSIAMLKHLALFLNQPKIKFKV